MVNWAFILSIFIMAFGVVPIICSSLGEKWLSKKLRIHSRWLLLLSGLSVLFLTFIQTVLTERESSRAEADNKLLIKQNVHLTEELTRASGKHDIFPRFWFFRGSHFKFGSAELLGSTVPILIYNPGDYPIYDVEIQIIEVLEQMKWRSDVLSGRRSGRSIQTDSAGNIIPPGFVGTTFHFTVLLPKVYIQREIVAPPSVNKLNYVYYIAVSARNGGMRYRYHFIKIDPESKAPLMFDAFYMAYKILRVESHSDSTGTTFLNKLIEEYHDPKFPTNQDGSIDYGPELIGYVESNP